MPSLCHGHGSDPIAARRAVAALEAAVHVARAEEHDPEADEALQWLLDELEAAIAALNDTPGVGEA